MKHTKTISYSAKKVFTVLIAALLLSFAMYSFAIASATINISDSNILNDDIQELRTEIAGLEGSYYSMIDGLSIQQAQVEGFVHDDRVVFAHVNDATFVAYNN